MPAVAELVLRIEGKDDASRVLKGVKDEANGLGKALGDVGKIAAGVAIGQGIPKLASFLGDAAQAAADDEQATMRLEQALRNTTGAFEDNLAAVNARIEAGADLAFSDDDVRDSFQQLLAATNDTDEALRRQALAMDFARGAGIPLEQASKLLGKVTEENVEVFKRMGITIGEGATEAEAFAVIQGKFAGQAEVYANSTAGQFEQTKIKMGELKEQIGVALLPVMTKIGTVLVEDVIPKLEQFANWWGENVQPKIAAFVEYIQVNVMPEVKRQFAKFQEFYETEIKPALENVMRIIEEVVRFIIEHWSKIEPFVRPIFIAIELMANTMRTAIKLVLDLLQGDWDGAWADIREMVQGVANAIILMFESVRDQILEVVRILKGAIEGMFSGLGGAISGAFSTAMSGVRAAINTLIDFYNDTLGRIPGVPTIGRLGGDGTGTGGGETPGRITVDNGPSWLDGILFPPASAPPIGLPGLPAFASGGVVTRPTVALIGEDGPEAIVPLSGMRGGGGSRGRTGILNFTINISAIDGESVRRIMPTLVDEMNRELGRNYA